MTNHQTEPTTEAAEPTAEPVADQVEVRRNGTLAAAIGAVAAVVAVAYLVRAIGGGSLVDWLVFLAVGALAVAHAASFLDSRTPLLVADRTGIRIRLGRSWQGLPWDDLEEVEHAPRHTVLRDGRLVAFPVDGDAVLAGLDPTARRQAKLAERLHGAPFAVPLGVTTRVTGADDGLTAALLALAPDPDLVVEVVPDEVEWMVEEPEPVVTERPDDADLVDTAERPRPDVSVVPETAEQDVVEAVDPVDVVDADQTVVRPRPVLPTPTPDPLRAPAAAVRAEVTRPAVRHDDLPPMEDTGVWRSETVLIDETAGPAREPVIGPQLTRAREAIGLDVDRLAERTRIRAHVIDAIELDDFGPCGGDFYARGHLRTLARVLGVDAAPLVSLYDDLYADAPIDARKVFEAELATGSDGAIRALRGAPSWSVLVSAVMAVVLVWSVARLVLDGTPDPESSTATLSSSDSAGLSTAGSTVLPKVPLVITAAGGGAKVVVRDGAGSVVFKGDLAFGQTKTLQVSPPARVQSSDGSLTVAIDGGKAAAMGRTGASARNTYVPPAD